MTNAIELQKYINTTGAEPWFENSGMLGLGLFGSLAATALLFLVILYVIGVIQQYRKNKRWMNLGKRYWFEVLRGLGISMKTWSGIATPRAYVSRSDGKYGKLTFEEARSCLEYARGMMMPCMDLMSYKSRSFDCENFAMAMHSFASLYASRNFLDSGEGAPFFLFGYTRKDGKKHVILRVVIDGKTNAYFEPYPEGQYSKALRLTKQEIASCDLDFG